MKGKGRWIVEEGFPGFDALDQEVGSVEALIRKTHMGEESMNKTLLHSD